MSDIKKAFNLPLRSDGVKLIESTGNVCATFNLPNEASAVARFVNTCDDQVQQLNREIVRQYGLILVMERRNNELYATVERLRSISEAEYADEDERIADIQGVLESTPQQNLAEHDAEVARKAVEEYKLSITEPNATVHRYPVVDLNGLYLPGADGRPMLVYGHIDNAESPSHQAFIKCVIGRLLEILEEFDDEPSIVQKKNTDKPSVIRASFIDGYTAGNGYPPSDWEVNQYLESVKE